MSTKIRAVSTGRWARFAPGLYGIPRVAIAGESSALLPRTPESLGFAPLGTFTGSRTLEPSDRVQIALDTTRTAKLIKRGGDLASPLFLALFDDGHPQLWLDQVVRDGGLVVLIGSMDSIMSRTPESEAQFRKRMSSVWVANVPLAR
jgi:hypothetical protein